MQAEPAEKNGMKKYLHISFRELKNLKWALSRIGVLTTWGQVLHRGSVLNLHETLDLPAQVPRSPPGFGVLELDLRCAAATGHRAVPQRVRIAALPGHQLTR